MLELLDAYQALCTKLLIGCIVGTVVAFILGFIAGYTCPFRK